MTVLKSAIQYIAEPLCNIFNWSFTTGIFPAELKPAIVTPIFKNGDPHTINNYRPISILPAFSKILEKLVNNRLTDFLEKQKILFPNQYGFRKNHDTSLAVTELTEHIAAGLDDRELSLGIFLDLSKAFDSLDHSILLKKLDYYGIRGTALSWFHNSLAF